MGTRVDAHRSEFAHPARRDAGAGGKLPRSGCTAEEAGSRFRVYVSCLAAKEAGGIKWRRIR